MQVSWCRWFVHSCMHACAYINIKICMRVHKYVSVCLRACIGVCVCVCDDLRPFIYFVRYRHQQPPTQQTTAVHNNNSLWPVCPTVGRSHGACGLHPRATGCSDNRGCNPQGSSTRFVDRFPVRAIKKAQQTSANNKQTQPSCMIMQMIQDFFSKLEVGSSKFSISRGA